MRFYLARVSCFSPRNLPFSHHYFIGLCDVLVNDNKLFQLDLSLFAGVSTLLHTLILRAILMTKNLLLKVFELRDIFSRIFKGNLKSNNFLLTYL
jgi:hypothetical protein